MIFEPGLERPLAIRLLAVARDRDEVGTDTERAELAAELVAVHHRQSNVEDCEIRLGAG